MITKRGFITVSAAGFLAACAKFGSGMTLDEVKSYASDAVNGMAAENAVFQASPKFTADQKMQAQQALSAAQNALAQLNGMTGGDSKSIVSQIITAIQTLAPLYGPLMGDAGLALPFIVAALQAYVNAQPAPTDPNPKATAKLRTKAITYKLTHG